MLETLVFREIRYSSNNEQELIENENRLNKNPNDTVALQNLASIYHALKENEKAIERYNAYLYKRNEESTPQVEGSLWDKLKNK